MLSIDQIKLLLRMRLSEYRYNHSLNVADEAARLAEKYGADIEKAYFAGLIHDCMKDVTPDEAKEYMKNYGISLTELDMNAKSLWHAILGADYAARFIGVSDDDIINAVRYHTTARAGMSLLEKAIYLADYTSADRSYNGVEEMRAAVDESIEKAMKIALEFTVSDLNKKGAPVHPDTLSALDEINEQSG